MSALATTHGVMSSVGVADSSASRTASRRVWVSTIWWLRACSAALASMIRAAAAIGPTAVGSPSASNPRCCSTKLRKARSTDTPAGRSRTAAMIDSSNDAIPPSTRSSLVPK